MNASITGPGCGLPRGAAGPPAGANTLGTGGVLVAGVALVVSASTFVSEFTGFIAHGAGFALALVLGGGVVLPVALAAADLAVCHPRIGGVYRFAQAVIRGAAGKSCGLFCSLLFLAAFLFGSAGETIAGAHVLRALCRSDLPVECFVPLLLGPALAANLGGLRCATWFTGALLALMLGVRWAVGIAGFAGWAETGSWRLANLLAESSVGGGRDSNLLVAGLALACWSFVGIESTASLASQVRHRTRSLPRGMLLGLGLILLTTLVMGAGSIGTQSRAEWHALLAASTADAPHLAVGAAMLGEGGRLAMAAAAIAATWSTLLIALAAVPRMIVALSQDGLFFGPASRFFAEVRPRTGVPLRATLLVVALQLGVVFGQGGVADCIQAAAYLWFLRYLILLGLAGANRWRRSDPAGILRRPVLLAIVGLGVLLVLAAWRLAFAGVQSEFGAWSLGVLGAVGMLTLLAWTVRLDRPGRLRVGQAVRPAPMALVPGA